MRIFWAFVFAFALSVTFVSSARANEEPKMETEISSDFSSEGFGMSYSESDIQSLRYETIMERWKKKQLHLWENMSYEESFTINASAYTASADECGKSDGITASGVKVEEKRTLACPPQYPFGTRIEIETMGTYTCEDRGGAIKGNKFDIYMETKSDAFAFGRRNLVAKIVQ